MKRILPRALIAIIIVLSIWYFPPVELGTLYHDGVCGAQKWERHFFGLDLSEKDYDEFDIEKRWTSAHNAKCVHVWERGPLESDSGAYWPKLHLEVAQGAEVSRLERTIASTPIAALKKRDLLGRTILHWLVIHPDHAGRQRLIDELVRRGLDLDAKDHDGLSPRDWASQARKREDNELRQSEHRSSGAFSQER